MPAKASSETSPQTRSPPRNSRRLPTERELARATGAPSTQVRFSRSFSMARPTRPVAPKTATLILSPLTD